MVKRIFFLSSCGAHARLWSLPRAPPLIATAHAALLLKSPRAENRGIAENTTGASRPRSIHFFSPCVCLISILCIIYLVPGMVISRSAYSVGTSTVGATVWGTQAVTKAKLRARQPLPAAVARGDKGRKSEFGLIGPFLPSPRGSFQTFLLAGGCVVCLCVRLPVARLEQTQINHSRLDLCVYSPGPPTTSPRSSWPTIFQGRSWAQDVHCSTGLRMFDPR